MQRLQKQRLHESQRRGRPLLRYIRPESLEDALNVLAEAGPRAQAVAGGTDLLLELAREQRPEVDTLVDLTVLDELAHIDLVDGQVSLGSLVTHSDVLGYKPMRTVGLPLAQACFEVGSPQLRNRATIAGNVVTASPANDTISALHALDAVITVASINDGETHIPISEFITGYRKTILRPGELVTRITFKALRYPSTGIFVKLGLRRAQAISVVHIAVVARFTADVDNTRNVDNTRRIDNLKVALGSVGPTVVDSEAASEVAQGRVLSDPDLASDVAAVVCDSISPIDDLRSTAQYRYRMVKVAVRRAMESLASGKEASTWSSQSPRLVHASYNGSAQNSYGDRTHATDGDRAPATHGDRTHAASTSNTSFGGAWKGSAWKDGGNIWTDDDAIFATVNGIECSGANSVSRTLLDWLRLDMGLTGTKEGCAEGECGSCTVHLNGRAVLACLVPAAHVHGSEITTVEGIATSISTNSGCVTGESVPRSAENATENDCYLAGDDVAGETVPCAGVMHPVVMHPVQQALADLGGVQCGFCTPGFVMSAVMLVSEYPQPDKCQVEDALSGNLCRCTGYYPIIEALAAKMSTEQAAAYTTTPSAQSAAPS